MAKGGIPDVVGQAGSGNDVGKLVVIEFPGPFTFHVVIGDIGAGDFPQGPTYAGHLKGMGEAVVDESASRKGKDLGLVL